MTPYLNRLDETVHMWGHNVYFYVELAKFIHKIIKYSLLSRALTSDLCKHIRWICRLYKGVVSSGVLIFHKGVVGWCDGAGQTSSAGASY